MRNVIIGKEGKVSANSHAAYRYYKENAKHRNKDNTYQYSQYSKILNTFFKKIGRDLVENEAGVFIKNLGYFTVVRHPKKQVVKVNYLKGKEFFNSNTDNYLWTPTFFGFAKRRRLLKYWCMDRTFSRSEVKAPLHKKLIKGVKYKTLISTLASLYLLNNKQ